MGKDADNKLTLETELRSTYDTQLQQTTRNHRDLEKKHKEASKQLADIERDLERSRIGEAKALHATDVASKAAEAALKDQKRAEHQVFDIKAEKEGLKAELSECQNNKLSADARYDAVT